MRDLLLCSGAVKSTRHAEPLRRPGSIHEMHPVTENPDDFRNL